MSTSKERKEEAAKKANLTVTEYNRRDKERVAMKRGMTLKEYQKQIVENLAKERGITAQEYRKQCQINTAERQGLTITEYNKRSMQRTAEKHGMSVAEYYKLLREKHAEDLGMTLNEYYAKCRRTTAENKGLTYEEYIKQLNQKSFERSGYETKAEYRRAKYQKIADNRGIPLNEYYAERKNVSANNKGFTDYKEQKRYKDYCSREGVQISIEDFRQLEKDFKERKEYLKSLNATNKDLDFYTSTIEPVIPIDFPTYMSNKKLYKNQRQFYLTYLEECIPYHLMIKLTENLSTNKLSTQPEVVQSYILKGLTFQEIGDTHGISKQRSAQLLKQYAHNIISMTCKN